MGQISAADNLVIDMDTDGWRLLLNTGGAEAQMLLKANAGAPLRYPAGFGNSRRLPAEGLLEPDRIQRVVLGWSAKDEAWHLGLLLESELAMARGSRWCELAHWPDPDTTVFIDLASEAGKSLAGVISRPFNLIPPRIEPKVEPPPPPPLPELPLRLGIWTLQWTEGANPDPSQPRSLEFVRAGSWAWSRVTRIIWYSLWIIVYVVLSVATITGRLALPNSGTMLPDPNLLPYLGLVSAVILTGMILYMLYELLRKPNRIIVDPGTHTIRALRGKSPRWTVRGDRVQSVYVTQVVGKKSQKPVVSHGELNLHLGGGEFFSLLVQDQNDDDKKPWKFQIAVGEEGIMPLTGEVLNTNLQTAGLYTARTLGDMPCWYDQRRK